MYQLSIYNVPSLKYVCNNEVNGFVYVEKMVREFCEVKGLVIVGSYGGDYVLEDKICKRFQAKCIGRDQLRWIKLIPTKRKKLDSAELVETVTVASINLNKLDITENAAVLDSQDFASDLLQYCE